MENNFSYPYRRFSSDIYAEGLMVLLEENQIPYELVGEPEGMSSVILGQSVVPGVIVMVREADALKINQLEKKNNPEKAIENFQEEKEFDSLAPWWIVCGYIMVIVFSPISIILGLHLMTAKRRQADMTYRKAYPENIQLHGKIIFWAGLVFISIGLVEMILLGSRGSIWDSSSYVIRRFTKY